MLINFMNIGTILKRMIKLTLDSIKPLQAITIKIKTMYYYIFE